MALKQITLKEVSEHNNVVSLWIALDNKVYDITKFLTEVCRSCISTEMLTKEHKVFC